jgi:outer membrane protein assembly factor BamB
MRLSRYFFLRLFLFLLILSGLEVFSLFLSAKNPEAHLAQPSIEKSEVKKNNDSIEIKVGTFLGNASRNYYGDSIGNDLQLIWKTFLGKGTTIVTASKGVEEWFGAGWTGEPLVVKEKGKTFLIQGAFDHHLKKIDAATGEVIWNYEYDDILKGTGTIWVNDSARDPLNRIVILQGSRKGVQNSMASPACESFRAVSFFTGKEIWRYNVKQTASYSRDVDASALIVADTAYVGLENGKFISFDPGKKTLEQDSFHHPVVYSEQPLYNAEDNAHHGGNLVTESSPARIGDHLYITAGSGHVYGYNLLKKIIDWDFYIGSDMDGTPVVTSDSCLLVEVEKQYISGKGGVFKLDPRKDPADCVDWYFPTADFHFSGWDGGVIGSVCTNDSYNDGSYLHLAAFTGIDGMLNVVRYDLARTDSTVEGPDGKTKYPVPVVVFQNRIGPSISTPVFSKNKLVAAGYNGIHLFCFNQTGNFKLLNSYPGNFEASPTADAGKIYIASRDGYLYCFGDTTQKTIVEPEPIAVVTLPAKAKIDSPKKISAPVVVAKPKLHLINKTLAEAMIPARQKYIAEHPVIPSTVIAANPPAGNKVQPSSEEIKTPPGDFHLIAGVFRIESNAKNFVKTWKGRGIEASIMISPNGMYYVSLADGNSEDELKPLMQTVKTKYKADAWIFTREE